MRTYRRDSVCVYASIYYVNILFQYWNYM